MNHLWWGLLLLGLIGCSSLGPDKTDTQWIRSVDSWGSATRIVYEYEDGSVGTGIFCETPPLWKGMHATYTHHWDGFHECEQVTVVERAKP